jgi:hypothetical protein
MTQGDPNILFYEIQRPRQIWIWGIVLAATGAAWVTFIQQFFIFERQGADMGADIFTIFLLVIFGLAFPLFVAIIKLEITVRTNGITINFFPLIRRKIKPGSIKNVEARDYRPFREYGGWGIRYSPRYGKAYNMSGKHGVQLILTDGMPVLLGSQRADELAEVITGITVFSQNG